MWNLMQVEGIIAVKWSQFYRVILQKKWWLLDNFVKFLEVRERWSAQNKHKRNILYLKISAQSTDESLGRSSLVIAEYQL